MGSGREREGLRVRVKSGLIDLLCLMRRALSISSKELRCLRMAGRCFDDDDAKELEEIRS